MKELKRLMLVAAVFVVALLPAAALAQDPNLNPDENLGGVLGFLASAFQGGQFWVVGATAIMLAVWLVAKFIVKDPLWLGFLAPVVGVLASCAIELAKPEADIGTAIYQSFTASGPAALMWSSLGKLIFSKDARAKFAKKVEDRKLKKATKKTG